MNFYLLLLRCLNTDKEEEEKDENIEQWPLREVIHSGQKRKWQVLQNGFTG